MEKENTHGDDPHVRNRVGQTICVHRGCRTRKRKRKWCFASPNVRFFNISWVPYEHPCELCLMPNVMRFNHSKITFVYVTNEPELVAHMNLIDSSKLGSQPPDEWFDAGEASIQPFSTPGKYWWVLNTFWCWGWKAKNGVRGRSRSRVYLWASDEVQRLWWFKIMMGGRPGNSNDKRCHQVWKPGCATCVFQDQGTTQEMDQSNDLRTIRVQYAIGGIHDSEMMKCHKARRIKGRKSKWYS